MSIAALAFIALPVAILGGLLVFFVLRFLHRRLRLFTRGTIAFMTFVLVLFTVVDLVVLAQEVRDRDAMLRQEAVRNVVAQTAHRVFDSTELFVHDEDEANGLDAEFLRVRQAVHDQIEERNDCCDASDCRLVAYRVRPANRFYSDFVPGRQSQRWEVDAVLVDPDLVHAHFNGRKVYKRPMHCVLTVYTLLDENGTPRVTAIDGGTAVKLKIASRPSLILSSPTWHDPDMKWIHGVGLVQEKKSS